MGLHPITSPLLSEARHGFFTRLGGVSTGIFEALNCGYGSPEDGDAIRQNRALIARHVGVEEAQLFSVTQTHSADVITINAPSDFSRGAQADAMVSSTNGVALGVLTADCAPVLFQNKRTGVIGAAHAGWRGALGGVLEATIAQMCGLGADRDGISAAIGPCISQRNYEVGQEFFEEFIVENTGFAQFFVNGSQDKYLFDLPGFVLNRIRNAGIDHVEWTGHCTYASPQKFYSYRYSQHHKMPSYGRMLSVITN